MSRKVVDSKALTMLAAGFTTHEDARYYLCAVAFYLGPGGLEVVSTDGHTLFHGLLRTMTTMKPMTGMLQAPAAAKGEEPDMELGDAGFGEARFPKHGGVVEKAGKQLSKGAILLDQAAWKDFDWAAKMAKVIAPESSLLPVKLRVDEGRFVVEAAERYTGDSMRHELLWPTPTKPWTQDWEPTVGIQATFVRRFAGAALTLDKAAWSFVPPLPLTEEGMFCARGTWDEGEVTLVAMPCRL